MCSKLRYEIFQKTNNIGADQSVQAGRCLCCLQTSEDRVSRVKAHILKADEKADNNSR